MDYGAKINGFGYRLAHTNMLFFAQLIDWVNNSQLYIKCFLDWAFNASRVGESTYTSDVTCGNTIFHVELVHNSWIKVAHQNLQRLICLVVLPILWQVQSEQIPAGRGIV